MPLVPASPKPRTGGGSPVTVMDRDTAEHFYAWLEKYVHESDQNTVEDAIRALLASDPDLLAQGRTWPELRRLAGV